MRSVVRATLPAVALLGPLLALLAVWGPLLAHYHVADLPVTPGLVGTLRRTPTGDIFTALDDIRYDTPMNAPDTAVKRADEFLRERFPGRGGDILAVGPLPNRAALAAGMPGDQLDVSSMIVADTLLEAYRRTGQERYLAAAWDSAVAWARFEHSAWFPVGLLWNDHAIAARLLVLSRLWGEVRGRADLDVAEATDVLAFVSRSVRLLAAPTHYTPWTNHGIMQNLALLHAGIAFPGLAGTTEGVRVAIERLGQHLPYYVADGGVVLEHSAGYHDFAIHLLGLGMRYLALLGEDVPAAWRDRYRAAECWQRRLLRPDGTLPGYGDTAQTPRSAALMAESAHVVCAPGAASWLDEEFGYAALRGGGAPDDQLFMTWANFAGRAHKHDDELAVWLWAAGRDWLAASGYWPYGDIDRDAAVSWRGTNAPHDTGEEGRSGGASRLLGSALGGSLQLLDVERQAPDGRYYRRQVVGIAGEGLLVVDTSRAAEGPRGGTTSVWTFSPGTILQRHGSSDTAIQLLDPQSGRTIGSYWLCAPRCTVTRLAGSRRPFGGLVADAGVIRPTESLVVAVEDGGWRAVFWATGSGDEAAPAAVALEQRGDAGHWLLSIERQNHTVRVQRDGATLSREGPSTAATTVPVHPAAAQHARVGAATARYLEVADRFPLFRDHIGYRWKATAAILALAVAQVLVLWLLARLGAGRGVRTLLASGGWLAITGWLYYVYL